MKGPMVICKLLETGRPSFAALGIGSRLSHVNMQLCKN
jgi:hypothetical protein